jgi:hypothetical protein
MTARASTASDGWARAGGKSKGRRWWFSRTPPDEGEATVSGGEAARGEAKQAKKSRTRPNEKPNEKKVARD